MIPDLGAYTVEVTLAYAGSLIALALIVWVSVVRARRIRAALDEAESRWNQHER